MTSKSPSSPPPSTTAGATSTGPNTAFPPSSYPIPTGSSSADLFPSSHVSISDSLQSFSYSFAFDDPDWDWEPDYQNLEPHIENYTQLSPFEAIEHPVQNSGDVNSGNRELKIDDGYKWKKSTDRKVKSGHKRIYYKCLYALCKVKKTVETSSDGDIIRIIYHGKHDHTKPRSTIRSPSSSASDQQLNVFQGPSSGSGQTQENPIQVSDDDVDPILVIADESQSNKRQKIESRQNEDNTISIQIKSDIDILEDGYIWKKYCKKIVKGNPNPRIYFKCTSPDCPVKKQVERAPNDITSVITTYERKHNHPVPVAGSGQDHGRSSLQPANSSSNVGTKPVNPPPDFGSTRFGSPARRPEMNHQQMFSEDRD